MKIHHCMADGVSGNDLFTVILDRERETPRTPAGVWRPAPEPSSIHLAADAMWRLALIPGEALGALRRATGAPRGGAVPAA